MRIQYGYYFNTNFETTRKIAVLIDALKYARMQAAYYTTCIAHLFTPAKCEGRQNRSIKCAYLIVTVRHVTVYAETNYMSANKVFQFFRDIKNTALGLSFYRI